MTNRTRFLAVAFAALCAAPAHAGEDELNDTVKLTASLTEVTNFPEAFRRVPFELELLYHGPRELYNPYYTLFEPATYLNFAAWPADKPVWTRDGFIDDYPLFYVDRKNKPLEGQMVALRPFTWFTAHCIVKSTAQGRAWIEVLSVTSSKTMLDVTDMRHLVKANVLASGGEYDRALLEFGMAKLAEAPPRFVARCHADQGKVALSAGLPGRAMTEFQAALTALPEDKELMALLDRANSTVTSPGQQKQVAKAPSGIPPPLNLNGGERPPRGPEPARATSPSGTGTAAGAPNPPKSEPTKTAAPAANDSTPKSEPAVAPKNDAAPATKTPPAPKPDATSAPKTEPKVEPKPAEPKPAAKVEPKVESKIEPKSPTDGGEKPAPTDDGAKPAAKPADAPAPKDAPPAPADKPADKPADTPDAKKDETPAPSEPKPADAPAGKPGDAPAEKPENSPAEKPADPPADKPKPDNGN